MIMAASDSMQKKRNNYKLITDPELKKNAKKLYRLNGVTYRLNGKDITGVSISAQSWCAKVRPPPPPFYL